MKEKSNLKTIFINSIALFFVSFSSSFLILNLKIIHFEISRNVLAVLFFFIPALIIMIIIPSNTPKKENFDPKAIFINSIIFSLVLFGLLFIYLNSSIFTDGYQMLIAIFFLIPGLIIIMILSGIIYAKKYKKRKLNVFFLFLILPILILIFLTNIFFN